jgi:hypothetical protein
MKKGPVNITAALRDMRLKEGTWHISKNMTKLKQAMKKPMLRGKVSIQVVQKVIGDDELWDDLEGLKKGEDMVPAIKKAMKRLGIKEEVNEAKRIRPIKGLWTPKQMYTQVARTEKAANELRQHADFIFQMDADVGPSMSRNSGLYMDVYDSMTAALDQFDKAIKDAKRIKHPD